MPAVPAGAKRMGRPAPAAAAQQQQQDVDYDTLACLLCRRKFPTRDVLNKHVDKSGLHKVGTLLLLVLCFCFF